MIRSDMHGFPVFSIDGPRPFTAILDFRVGIYDETLPMRGITHLVEHLAMFNHRETEINFNASVGPHLTSFWAQGHPDEVGRFMGEVAHSIHHLPFDRLDVESGVLQREADAGASYLNELVYAYFGPVGPGVAGFPEIGLTWLGPDELTGWANRYFTRQNAALVVIGSPPGNWDIELPDGMPMHYQVPPRRRVAPEIPTLFATQDHGVTWAALARDTKAVVEPELAIATTVLTRRLQSRLRHDLGQTYSVGEGFQRLDEHHLMIFHGFDADPSQSRDVAAEHLKVISEFADQGPTQEEVDRYTRVFEKGIEDHPQDYARYFLAETAEAHLQGWQGVVRLPEWLEACKTVSTEKVRERFAEAYRQSYVISNLEERELAGLSEIIKGQEAPMPGVAFGFRRLRIPPKHPSRIQVGPDGVSLRWSDGWVNEPFDEIEMISTRDGSIAIVASLTDIEVEGARYRRRSGDPDFAAGVRTLEDALRKYLPEDVFLPVPRSREPRS